LVWLPRLTTMRMTMVLRERSAIAGAAKAVTNRRQVAPRHDHVS
jgi:hypothetical protein